MKWNNIYNDFKLKKTFALYCLYNLFRDAKVKQGCPKQRSILIIRSIQKYILRALLAQV